MDKDRLERLLVDLKRSNDLVRDRATAALWHEWFHQQGVHGAQQLIEAQTLLDAGRIGEAALWCTARSWAKPSRRWQLHRRYPSLSPSPSRTALCPSQPAINFGVHSAARLAFSFATTLFIRCSLNDICRISVSAFKRFTASKHLILWQPEVCTKRPVPSFFRRFLYRPTLSFIC